MHDATAGENPQTFLEAIDEERDRIDYVGLKRSLETEFDLGLTISGIQCHFDEHLVYV